MDLFSLIICLLPLLSQISTTDQLKNQHKQLLKQQFEDYLTKFNITFANEYEKHRRLKVFKKNLRTIDLLNENEEGTAIYGITPFTHLTEEEFQSYTGYKPSLKQNSSKIKKKWTHYINYEKDFPLPESFDWRNEGVVTDVKNQGFCGSCWAFSATGNVESVNAISSKNLISLSEQELVDCDKLDQGCNGGLMDNAFNTIIKMGGLESETDYPYDGHNEKCHFNQSLAKVKIDAYTDLPQDEEKLAQWLVKNGPISVALNANAMQFYFGGISKPFKIFCNPLTLNHGVLIVGYGVGQTRILKRTLPYWIIKNSWGPNWGEKGYYLLYRGGGACGVNRQASSAIIGSKSKKFLQ